MLLLDSLKREIQTEPVTCIGLQVEHRKGRSMEEVRFQDKTSTVNTRNQKCVFAVSSKGAKGTNVMQLVSKLY